MKSSFTLTRAFELCEEKEIPIGTRVVPLYRLAGRKVMVEFPDGTRGTVNASDLAKTAIPNPLPPKKKRGNLL